MALLDSVPQQKTAQLIRGMKNKFQVVPRDFDGAIVDLTGFNAGTMNVWPQAADKGEYNVANANVVALNVADVAGDATGAEITIANGELQDAIDACFGLPMAFFLQLGDGTDTIQAAFGTLQITEIGLS